jgi:hypothetical protein
MEGFRVAIAGSLVVPNDIVRPVQRAERFLLHLAEVSHVQIAQDRTRNPLALLSTLVEEHVEVFLLDRARFAHVVSFRLLLTLIIDEVLLAQVLPEFIADLIPGTPDLDVDNLARL